MKSLRTLVGLLFVGTCLSYGYATEPQLCQIATSREAALQTTNNSELFEGTYRTRGKSYFAYSSFNVGRWANQYLVETVVKYGNYHFDAEALLENCGGGVYEGIGHIKVQYERKLCKFRYTLNVQVVDGKAYIKGHAPDSIPEQVSSSAPCDTIIGSYSWYLHPDPYEFQG